MRTHLSIGEKLKDLRTEKKLTLLQLEKETGISKSVLAGYEKIDDSNNQTIDNFALAKLASYYNVSADFLLGLTDNLNEAHTPIEELHLTDEAIEILKSGDINPYLLSEMIIHPKFITLMEYIEIYIHGIATFQFNLLNAQVEIMRANIEAMRKKNKSKKDFYEKATERAFIGESDFFSYQTHRELLHILKDLRQKHREESENITIDKEYVMPELKKESILHTAKRVESYLDDENTTVEDLENEESPINKELTLLALGFDPDALTQDEYSQLMKTLNKSMFKYRFSKKHRRKK